MNLQIGTFCSEILLFAIGFASNNNDKAHPVKMAIVVQLKKVIRAVSKSLTSSSEAWRYTGPFTRWNRFKHSFPGFGIGLGAFLVYSAYEAAFVKE